jgi:Family of unknown function (DUF6525)
MAKQGGFKSGSYSYASEDSQWRAYERLPPSVRLALQEAAFDWAAYPIWRAFEAGRYKSAKELVRKIKEWDAKQIKKDRKRVWG